MVSLATLFPVGLMKLRTAQRLTRSVYLVESAAADMETRNLLHKTSFTSPYLSPWYNLGVFTTAPYDPWIQDTPVTPLDAFGNPPGVRRTFGVGLPVAYDPLWRWQTNFPTGYYPAPLTPGAVEARFGNGQGYVQVDGDGFVAADGLQRLTNFFPNTPSDVTLFAPGTPYFGNVAIAAPDIFVSPEDIVWDDSEGKQASTNASPVVPDLLAMGGLSTNYSGGLSINDWRYSWMFTGQQCDANNGTVFDGDVVIFENRQFGIDVGLTAPVGNGQTYQVRDEIVAEGVFGYSTFVFPTGPAGGFGRGADNVVLIRWPAAMPDPTIQVGSWIADVTYTRSAAASITRQSATVSALSVLGTKAELASGLSVAPPQRCYWYQVSRKSPPAADTTYPGFRSMTVWTATPLRAKTLLNANGTPHFFNTVLIAPQVVNVFSKTFYTR